MEKVNNIVVKSSINIPKLLIIVFIAGLAGLIGYGYLIHKRIEQKGIVSVGKYLSHKWLGKHEYNTFIYYRSGVQHTADGGKAPEDFKNGIGSFFEIHYSQDIPGVIIANYSKEIKDRKTILDAGFPVGEISLPATGK